MQRSPSSVRVGQTGTNLVLAITMLVIAGSVWADGWRPFARSDSITVIRGGVADRLSDGNLSVLDNDFDFEGDELTAALNKEPEHGTLEFREDGTFLYQHDGSDKDEDSFRYRAFDGSSYSRDATVHITIEDTPNSPPFVVDDVPDQEAIVGVEFRLMVAGNFADPDTDDVLRFSASGLPKSRSLRIDEGTGVLSGTPEFGDARNNPYTVEITATDREGATAQLTFQLMIFEDNRADVALDIGLATNPITVGNSAQWNIRIENRGPGDLMEGQFDATWTTSGPVLTLAAPGFCQISGNATRTPGISCPTGFLEPNSALTIDIDGTQDGAGDNSLIGIVSADDPILANNADLASAYIVAEFSEGPTQTIEMSANGVDAGDLDGDGAIDVVATHSETLIFFNNGAREVTTPGRSLGADSGGAAVAVLDWNGDGALDIAVGGLSDRTVEIFVNDGTGEFSSTDRLQNGGVGLVNDMIAVDLNNDGRSELILAGSSASGILFSRDQGGFDNVVLPSGAGRDLAVADLDQDGDEDIVVVRAGDRTVDLHYNDGSGTMFSRTLLHHGSVATAGAYDLSGDGSPDLVLGIDGEDLSAPQNKLLYQQGDGNFSLAGSIGASPVVALLAGDVDLDGFIDIVAVNEASVHQVYLGAASGSFSLATEQIVSPGMKHGVLIDINGDESLDLIMAGRDAIVLEIHANNGIGRLGLGDRIAPELQLNGNPSMTIPAGSVYEEPGATATDDVDGDITDKIIVTGTVNAAVVGTYTVSYKVADRAGNGTTTTRTVIVGVNQGAGGGGGGGTLSLTALVLLLLFAWPAVPAFIAKAVSTTVLSRVRGVRRRRTGLFREYH